MDEYVTLAHGSGGKLTHDLVERVFLGRFAMTFPLTDSALLRNNGMDLAFTTDAYVVDPLFFPGGNIGTVAVCGTVNDLAVSGAEPTYLAASFTIEEGLSVSELEAVAESMAVEAAKAGVVIVTGDTKVVSRGKCDRLFITTSGIGFVRSGNSDICTGKMVKAGDRLILSGSLGNHAVAVLAARKNISYSSPVTSDCACLNSMIKGVLDNSSGVHFMRDLTRGGLAAVLNELAAMTGLDIITCEGDIPVDEPVRGLCEIMGFEPLEMANEGKVLFVVREKECETILKLIRTYPTGERAAVIGAVSDNGGTRVILDTISGGRRLLEMPSGLLIPRIC